MRMIVPHLLATLLLAALGAGPAAADELTGLLKKAKDTGAVTLGFRQSSLPFSYSVGAERPVGYAIDLCHEVVDDIAREIGSGPLRVQYKLVTPETRIEAVRSGEVDLECGSTTANVERRAQVSFSPVTYVSGTKLMVRRSSPVRSYRDLGGRKVVVTAGTTNEGAVRALVDRLKLKTEIVTAPDHAESFRMVQAGGADAFALDDVLLYGLIAAAGPTGAEFNVLPEDLSYEPYGLMFRRDDPALAAVVTGTFSRLAQSRELRWIYEKWFVKRLPGGQRLNIAMSEELAHAFELLGLQQER